jgi:hypothetical protein
MNLIITITAPDVLFELYCTSSVLDLPNTISFEFAIINSNGDAFGCTYDL